MDKNQVTQQGYDDLIKELDERKSDIRDKIADEIEKARQQGDLSENSAYKQAMESKEFNENRISQLEEIINNSEIITKESNHIIGIGNKVDVLNQTNGQEMQFFIVGAKEADPRIGKISIESPIGMALSGKKKDDIVKVNLPIGEVIYQILKVA